MAAKPQMTVRLAPSILHALIYIAEREGSTPAEVARTMITAASQQSLDRHGWRVDCQDAYMRWLAERRASDRDEIAGDIELEDGLSGGQAIARERGRPVEPVGPYGPTGDQNPLFDYSEQPPAALSEVIAEADRLIERFTPRGARKGRG